MREWLPLGSCRSHQAKAWRYLGVGILTDHLLSLLYGIGPFRVLREHFEVGHPGSLLARRVARFCLKMYLPCHEMVTHMKPESFMFVHCAFY